MYKVLLVDDSVITTNMVSDYLTGKGNKVSVTNSPFGVINLVKEFRPHVVLMDLCLPGLGGEKLLGVFKEKEKDLKFRVIIFSSMDKAYIEDLVHKGLAHDYYVKGGPLNDLDKKIARQVSELGVVQPDPAH